jgi:UDP-N-acetylmuramoylalanine--D-glutamate ligase
VDAWNGRHVLVLGAARQGIALTRWLCQHGATVTLSDSQAEAALPQARAALADLSIRWALGGHPLSLLDGTDTVCMSGGVPVDLPIVREAQRRGLKITNDTQIFMEVAPCRIVGITGSAGKTTTTALVGEMAKTALRDRPAPGAHGPGSVAKAYVGGNIGDPLLNYLDGMSAADLAIMEVSSFQLEQMTISPGVAAVLNITPNHLDRHGTMAAYTAAKARMIDFQKADDSAVLGHDDPGSWGLRNRVKGGLYSFGLTRPPTDLDGTFYEDGILYLVDRGVPIPLLRREQIDLRGTHNLLNALAAFAIGHAAGLPLDAMLTAAADFRGVPHRLQFVRVLNGASWYDDSIATAPERVMAAVQAFKEPLILLLGGRDKKLPWNELARLVCRRVDHVVLFGEAAGMIESEILQAQESPSMEPAGPTDAAARRKRPYSLQREAGLQGAVAAASRLAQPGDVVLLAPGGTSFDEFKDFEDRGAKFQSWVKAL